MNPSFTIKITRIFSVLRRLYSVFFVFSLGISSALFATHLEELETQVLTQYNDFIPQMETEIVHEIQLHPNSAYAHYLLSYVYLRIFSMDPERSSYAEKALGLAQQAIDLDETGEYGYLAMSDTYQALGFNEKAWSTLSHIPKKSWRVLYRAIKFQYEPVDSWKASQSLETSIVENPESRDILIPLLLTLIKNFDTKNFNIVLGRLTKHIDHPLLKQELAIQYIANGNFQAAKAIFDGILKISSERYPEIALNYGVLLFNEFHENDHAREILTQALNLHSFPKILRSESLMYLSLIYLKKNEEARFIQTTFEALESSPEQINTLEFIALGIIKIKPAQFKNYMDAVNARFPGHAEFYALLGNLYFKNLGQTKEAIANFEKAAILEPEASSEEKRLVSAPIDGL